MVTNTEKEIREYLNLKETNGVLFIKGSWGSGKTHIINKVIEDEKLKEKYNFIKVSLFGLNRAEEVDKSIKRHFLFSNELVDKVDKKRDTLTSISKNLIGKLKYGNIINQALSYNLFDLIEVEKEFGLIDKKETVIILDDIERSDIRISELLGLINNYCENKKIKTIIVGNEKEIDDLNRFNKFKEKVVFRTIKIDNDYNEIVDSIIDNYLETSSGYKEFLRKNKDVILKAFLKNEQEDIRILKSCLIDFERIYALLKKNNKDENKLLSEVLYLFCIYKYEIVLNNYTIDDNGNILLSNIDKYPELKENSLPPSLIKWLVDSEWKENEILDEIEK